MESDLSGPGRADPTGMTTAHATHPRRAADRGAARRLPGLRAAAATRLPRLRPGRRARRLRQGGRIGAAVSRLSVENPTDLPLLVYEGEEVLGAQQNRTFDFSVLVPAGELLGSGDLRRAGALGQGASPRVLPAEPAGGRSLLRRTKRATAKAAGRVDQKEVWAEVSGRLAEYGVHSDSAAMSDLYEVRRAELRGLGRRPPPRRPDRGAGLRLRAAGGARPCQPSRRFRRPLAAPRSGLRARRAGRDQPEPDPRRAEAFLPARSHRRGASAPRSASVVPSCSGPRRRSARASNTRAS